MNYIIEPLCSLSLPTSDINDKQEDIVSDNLGKSNTVSFQILPALVLTLDRLNWAIDYKSPSLPRTVIRLIQAFSFQEHTEQTDLLIFQHVILPWLVFGLSKYPMNFALDNGLQKRMNFLAKSFRTVVQTLLSNTENQSRVDSEPRLLKLLRNRIKSFFDSVRLLQVLHRSPQERSINLNWPQQLMDLLKCQQSSGPFGDKALRQSWKENGLQMLRAQILKNWLNAHEVECSQFIDFFLYLWSSSPLPSQRESTFLREFQSLNRSRRSVKRFFTQPSKDSMNAPFVLTSFIHFVCDHLERDIQYALPVWYRLVRGSGTDVSHEMVVQKFVQHLRGDESAFEALDSIPMLLQRWFYLQVISRDFDNCKLKLYAGNVPSNEDDLFRENCKVVVQRGWLLQHPSFTISCEPCHRHLYHGYGCSPILERLRQLAEWSGPPRDWVRQVALMVRDFMDTIQSWHGENPVGADDLLPALIHVIILANLPKLSDRVMLARAFVEENPAYPRWGDLRGEEAYWWQQYLVATEYVRTLSFSS